MSNVPLLIKNGECGVHLSRLIVAIPAYNEERVLGKVIENLRESLHNEEDCLLLVVDDGSTDGTAEVARFAGADIVISHLVNQGVAKAYRTAIRWAVRYNADVICTIDADGQFNPDDMTKLVEPIRNGSADLVIGSRFIDRSNHRSVPLLNLVTNKLMALMISIIIGKRIYDTETGYRAISGTTARQLELIGRASFSYDMILDLAWKGFRIQEVPVGVRYFEGRVSRAIDGFLKYGLKSLSSIVVKWFSLRGIFNRYSQGVEPVRIVCAPSKLEQDTNKLE